MPPGISSVRGETSGIYSLLSTDEEGRPRDSLSDGRRLPHDPQGDNHNSVQGISKPLPGYSSETGIPSHGFTGYGYSGVDTSSMHSTRPSSQDQIASILMRLSDVERRLDTIKPAQQPGTSASEIAAMRSLLVPAAQGGSRGKSDSQMMASSPTGDTPVYDNRHQTHHDVMESLSLRRDLSRPEDPPFGMWWTFTVEETLLWPILEFRGSINAALDVAMLGAEDDSDSEDDYDHDDLDEQDVMEESPADSSWSSFIKQKSKLQQSSRKDRRGLDDGTVVPELVDNFIRNVHPQCPVLDPGKLRSHAANVVENGLDWDARSCQVLLACALGAISSPWDRDNLGDYSQRKPTRQRYLLAREYFHAGQKRLGPLCTRSSLTAAQCLFLAGTYFMYMLRPVSGWRLLNAASIACRTYISKRMARESVGLLHNSSRSMEQRLYWSCFKAEREMACEFGMDTTGLNVIAYSTSLPTPPNGYANPMGQGAQSGPEPTAGQPLGRSTMPPEAYDDRSWYFFLTDIMLRKLEMRIDTYCQEKRREAYRRAGESPEAFYQSLSEAMKEFDYQLTCYYESLPPVMRFPLDELSPCPDELRQYLRCRLSSVRHDILQPALYVLLTYDVSNWSPALVSGMILQANAMLKLDVAFLWTAGSTHRDHNTWLALRKGVRAGLMLVAARRLKAQNRPGLEDLRVPDDGTCRDAAQALVRGLEYWQAESRDCATNLNMLRSLHSDFRN